MPASAAAAAAEGEEKAAEAGGRELLYCGTVRFDIMGRAVKGGVRGRGNLVSPTRLRPLVGVDIRFVASGCAACHCVALSSDGRCFSWGRNEKGQLGHGDTLLRNLPTVVSELSKYNIIAAGVGRNHTVVVTDEGRSFAFDDNRHGQLGMGSLRSGTRVSPVPCLVTKATNAVCGADFTVWLSSVEGSSILTAGLPQYGQLGHGSDNELQLIQVALFTPGVLVDMEGWATMNRRMSGNHASLKYFKRTISYLPVILSQLVLQVLRALPVRLEHPLHGFWRHAPYCWCR